MARMMVNFGAEWSGFRKAVVDAEKLEISFAKTVEDVNRRTSHVSKEALQKMQADLSKTAEARTKAFGPGAAGELAEMAVKGAALVAVLNATAAAYDRVAAARKRSAGEQKEQGEKFLGVGAAVAGMGIGGQERQALTAWLQTQSGAFTGEQQLGFLANLKRAAPGTGAADVKKLALAWGRSETLMGDQGAGLANAFALFKGKYSAEGLAGVALTYQQRAGGAGLDEEARTSAQLLMGQGVGPEDALGLVAAFKSINRPRAIAQIAGELSKHRTPEGKAAAMQRILAGRSTEASLNAAIQAVVETKGGDYAQGTAQALAAAGAGDVIGAEMQGDSRLQAEVRARRAERMAEIDKTERAYRGKGRERVRQVAQDRFAAYREDLIAQGDAGAVIGAGIEEAVGSVPIVGRGAGMLIRKALSTEAQEQFGEIPVQEVRVPPGFRSVTRVERTPDASSQSE